MTWEVSSALRPLLSSCSAPVGTRRRTAKTRSLLQSRCGGWSRSSASWGSLRPAGAAAPRLASLLAIERDDDGGCAALVGPAPPACLAPWATRSRLGRSLGKARLDPSQLLRSRLRRGVEARSQAADLVPQAGFEGGPQPLRLDAVGRTLRLTALVEVDGRVEVAAGRPGDHRQPPVRPLWEAGGPRGGRLQKRPAVRLRAHRGGSGSRPRSSAGRRRTPGAAPRRGGRPEGRRVRLQAARAARACSTASSSSCCVALPARRSAYTAKRRAEARAHSSLQAVGLGSEDGGAVLAGSRSSSSRRPRERPKALPTSRFHVASKRRASSRVRAGAGPPSERRQLSWTWTTGSRPSRAEGSKRAR